MAETQFLLAHISDLHFSAGTVQNAPGHSHSIELLRGLEANIGQLPGLDRLIVSGDISNTGDSQSLINASGWLFDQIPIGNGQSTGLRLKPDQVRVVPGNHDAWNAGSDGALVDRRQKSLAHYNYAFPKHAIAPKGCYFDWIEKDGSGVYVACIDSCFLGDTAKSPHSTFGTLRYDEAIAKGKLTLNQTETLLQWYDQGMRGTLQDPNRPGSHIDPGTYSKALKILVMHHYLFEPPEHKSDYFMRVQQRDLVFRNIALSDFDIMLCGHKHIAAFDTRQYGEHIDDRAAGRYMLNYFRRLIGLESLPVQLADEHGKKISKAITLVAQTIGSWFKRSTPNQSAGEIADKVFELLKSGLDDPDGLELRVRTFLHENGAAGASTLEVPELKAIQKRIAAGLRLQERKELRSISANVSKISSSLLARPFLQIMSGSSAKSLSAGDSKRSFNVYTIRPQANGWDLKCERYTWDGSSFSAPLMQQQRFDRKV